MSDVFPLLSAARAEIWVSGGIAVLTALVLTPLVAHTARAYGLVDRPTSSRWHDRPVALVGGIAIATAIGASVLVSSVLGAGILTGNEVSYPWPVWAGAGLLFGLGMADDLLDVRPEAKVLVQVVATAAVLQGGYEFWRGGPGWASVPLTFLWVIGVTNAFNLIDGIDGLAASVAAITGSTLLLVGLAVGHRGLAIVMAAVIGAAVGFLAHNAPPASVFMGDCGSLPLGYLLAVGALDIQGGGGPVVGTLVPIAVLAVPIFDTTFVTATRVVRGQPVAEGGTDHVHHRLIRLGASEKQALAILAVASAGFGGLALSALWMSASLVVASAALCLVMAGVFGAYLATIPEEKKAEAPTSPSGMTERVGALMRRFFGGVSWKSVAGVLADLLVVSAAFIIALHLRHGGTPPSEWTTLMERALPGIVAAKLLIFHVFGLYDGIWRHAGTPEIVRLASASIVASLVVGTGLSVVKELQAEAISVFILDGLITTIGIGGSRFAFRALRQYVVAHQGKGRKVLLYGSGPSSILAVRYLRQRSGPDRTVVGMLDDDPSRHGHRLQGTEVLGSLSDLPRLCSAHDVEEVIVPVPAVSKETRRRVLGQSRAAGVECKYFSAELQVPPEGEPRSSAESEEATTSRLR
jgi:UDP-GlcNAc:undecaprenyl-phosphate GlcNAc-1-phosphate transferase